MLALIQGFGSEGPREYLIGGSVGLVVTLAIMGFTYVLHRIQTAMHERHHERHHAETMAAHRAHARHGGYEDELTP